MKKEKKKKIVLTQTCWLLVMFTPCSETENPQLNTSRQVLYNTLTDLDKSCCPHVIHQWPFDRQQVTWYTLLSWKTGCWSTNWLNLDGRGQMPQPWSWTVGPWRHSAWNLTSYGEPKNWARNATNSATQCSAKHVVRAVYTKSSILQACRHRGGVCRNC